MNNVIDEKSKKFAIRIIKLYQYLCDEKKEYTLSKQILRSGTSIGANLAESECAMSENVREASQAQSRKDFLSKMNIALKEASETEYWLELLFECDYLSDIQYQSIQADCSELNKILITIVKSTKNNENI